MSRSSSKNKNRRITKRLGTKKFRRHERRIVEGDRPRRGRFCESWRAPLKEKDLPIL